MTSMATSTGSTTIDIATDDLAELAHVAGLARSWVLSWLSANAAQGDWHVAIVGHTPAPVTNTPWSAVQALTTHLAHRLQVLARRLSIAAATYSDGETLLLEQLHHGGAGLWRAGLGWLSGVLTAWDIGETSVSVQQEGRSVACAPVSGFGDLMQRVPAAGAGATQVRIEQRGDSAVVYIGGTSDFGWPAATEAFDMTSNIAALGGAGRSAASVRATEQAMRAAGITSTEPVTLVGHSQGGLVAARIAQSQQWAVSHVVTAGAPIRQIDLPPGIRVVAFEHVGDPIPGLSAASTTGVRVLSERRDTGSAIPTGGDTLPAHNLARYRETAVLADGSTDALLREERELLATPSTQTGSGIRPQPDSCTETRWRAERLPR